MPQDETPTDFWIADADAAVESTCSYRSANLHACAPHARCRQRFCQTCRAIKRKKVGDEIYKRTTDLPALHVTLSAPVSYAPLRQQIIALKSSMARLRRLSYWRKNVSGGEYCIDQTYNVASQAYNIHAHLVVSAQPLDAAELSALWLICSEGAYHVHIGVLTHDDEYRFRASHYGLKPLHQSIANNPVVRADFFAQTLRLRLIGTFGNWRGTPLLRNQCRAPERRPITTSHKKL